MCIRDRFINEIPQECLEFVRPKQTYKNSFYGSVVSEKLKQDGNEYGLGDRVLHKSFGEGVILSMEGEGDSARIQIHFDAVGTKWLVMSYANLEKL